MSKSESFRASPTDRDPAFLLLFQIPFSRVGPSNGEVKVPPEDLF